MNSLPEFTRAPVPVRDLGQLKQKYGWRFNLHFYGPLTMVVVQKALT